MQLALRGEDPAPASLFLPESPRRSRAQLLDDVRELLEQDRDFIPVKLAGERTLLARAAISYVVVARRPLSAGSAFSEEELSDVHTLFDHRIPVLLTLLDSGILRGALLFSSPPDRARLADFLNLGPRFLPLWRTDELVLVQRSAIRTIVESEPQGEPGSSAGGSGRA